jgi:hypothetical protein
MRMDFETVLFVPDDIRGAARLGSDIIMAEDSPGREQEGIGRARAGKTFFLNLVRLITLVMPGLAIQRGGHFSLRSSAGSKRKIERKLLVLALSRAYLVTGA